MEPWIQLGVAVLVNAVIVAYLYGRTSAKLEALADLVRKLCGDHDDIIVNKNDIGEMKKQIAWGTRQFQAIWRTFQNTRMGDRIQSYSAPADFEEPPS